MEQKPRFELPDAAQMWAKGELLLQEMYASRDNVQNAICWRIAR